MAFFLSSGFFLMLLGLASCDACIPKKATKEEAPLMPKTNVASHFSYDCEHILKKAPYFTYRAALHLLSGKGEHKKSSQEIVMIQAKDATMHLSKKIDNFHFFELLKDSDDFFVKNRLESWHRGFSNKSMYKNIFNDSLNFTAWIDEQFALNLPLKTHLSIADKDIKKDAPFLIRLAKEHSPFMILKTANFRAQIVVDEKTKLPLSAKFDVTIIGQEDHWLRLSLESSFSFNTVEAINVPPISPQEAVAAPVFIAPRFNELMNTRQK